MNAVSLIKNFKNGIKISNYINFNIIYDSVATNIINNFKNNNNSIEARVLRKINVSLLFDNNVLCNNEVLKIQVDTKIKQLKSYLNMIEGNGSFKKY